LSDQARALPDRPSLRFLKLEAKRRLAAGEFDTLNAAQLAIAREHGMSSWTALKDHISDGPDGPDGAALAGVRWVVSRFRDAGSPAWQAPADAELRAHFDDHYLELIPADTVVSTLSRMAGRLREEFVVTGESALRVRGQISGLRVEAAVEPEAPHRLTGLRLYPVGARVTDARISAPSTRTAGLVPAAATRVAEESFAEVGLVGLVVAGDASGEAPGWAAARGWADLERGELLRPDHRFPAYGITKVVTATAVLVQVGEGRIGLDEPANSYLSTVRLASDVVTVRDLLTHTGGVDGVAAVFADSVPEVAGLLGPVVGCGGSRGVFATSNAGYGVLGQLIADVAGAAFPEVVDRTVFAPLGMAASSFPVRWPDVDAVTGYQLGEDGTFVPAAEQLSTLPGAGGLWTTAVDLVRFGVGWSSLLPAELSREALRPHVAQRTPGASVGLGWLINGDKGFVGHAGVGPGAGLSLIIQEGAGRVSVVCTNRIVPVESVNGRLLLS
jgi:CubicO group peptidase (beta-lactamase class C family)